MFIIGYKDSEVHLNKEKQFKRNNFLKVSKHFFKIRTKDIWINEQIVKFIRETFLVFSSL